MKKNLIHVLVLLAAFGCRQGVPPNTPLDDGQATASIEDGATAKGVESSTSVGSDDEGQEYNHPTCMSGNVPAGAVHKITLNLGKYVTLDPNYPRNVGDLQGDSGGFCLEAAGDVCDRLCKYTCNVCKADQPCVFSSDGMVLDVWAPYWDVAYRLDGFQLMLDLPRGKNTPGDLVYQMIQEALLDLLQKTGCERALLREGVRLPIIDGITPLDAWYDVTIPK